MSTPTLITELEEVAEKWAKLSQEAGEEPSDEQQRDLDVLHEKSIELRTKIEEAKKAVARKDMDELQDFLNSPKYKAPRAINDDQDGRKSLRQMGWDCKSGIIMAPTSTGKMQEMFGEEVLFGELPKDDPAAHEFYKTTRASMQPEYRQAFIKYLRLCTKFRSESMAFSQMNAQEQKALSEGSDTAGGFLVPPDTQAEMLVRTATMSVMRRLARTVTTSRDKVIFPRVQAASATAGGLSAGGGSIFSSGFVGGWVGETPAFSDTDPAFGTFEVGIKKVRVATKLSNDWLSDAVSNPLAFLSANGAENMALVEDKGFIDGDGTALQPLGILNGGAATVDIEGTTSNTISNTSTDLGSATKLISLAYTVPSQYAERGQWLFRRAIEADIRKLTDFQGRYLWPAMAGSGLAGAPRELLGYPVNNSEFVPDDGTDANKCVIFGDFSSYIIAQRAQISAVILRERFADTDQTGIILFDRLGGALWNTDAIRYGVV